jgi:hypothetical protein
MMAGRPTPSGPDRCQGAAGYFDDDPRRTRSNRGRGRRHRRVIWGSGVIPAVAVAQLAWSRLGAYATPDNDSFSAKWAD